MRILVLSNLDMGLYKFRAELLEALIEKNEVIVSTPVGEYTDGLRQMGCHFIPCSVLERRSTNLTKDLKLLFFYCTLLKQVRPEVVLTYTIKPNVYGGIACALYKVPCIANATGLGTSIENGGVLAFITKNLYRIGLRKAACVFFQNESNRDLFIREGLVKGKTRLIPGSGVNLEQHCAEAYPDDKDGIHFLFVGRVMRDKGIGELLEAMRTVHAEFPTSKLDIVGSYEEDYSSAFKEAEKNGVHYLGPQKDMHFFYKNCHCTILPSYHEGTANVMLEASATARPVITTRVPGCSETFDEGITGFGCEAKDVDSLVNAICKFMNLSQAEREQMGKAAREKMKHVYDRNLVIRAYMEEINTITKED